MDVFNGTPHDVVFINPESAREVPEIRKLVSENPKIVRSIPSNGMLNAVFGPVVEIGEVAGIPVFEKKIVDFDPLPDAEVVIVSALYAKAIGPHPRVYTVMNPVYSPDGRSILGCLGIGKMS